MEFFDGKWRIWGFDFGFYGFNFGFDFGVCGFDFGFGVEFVDLILEVGFGDFGLVLWLDFLGFGFGFFGVNFHLRVKLFGDFGLSLWV